MKSLILVTIAGLVLGAAAATTWARAGTPGEDDPLALATQPTDAEIEASEGGILGARLQDGSLMVLITGEPENGASLKQCVFDAAVNLGDGYVRRVVQADRARNVAVGKKVVSADDAFAKGDFISVPSYVGPDGSLVIGYRECKELAGAE